MNARLQVEHPVTELVTGPRSRPPPTGRRRRRAPAHLPGRRPCAGSAIEVRLYAEDEKGLPSGGGLLRLRPAGGTRRPQRRRGRGRGRGLARLRPDDREADRPRPGPSSRRPTARLRPRRLRGPRTYPRTCRCCAASPPIRPSPPARPPRASWKSTTCRNRNPSRPFPAEAVLLAAATELCKAPASPEPFAAGPWRLLGASRLRFRAGDGTHEVEAGRSGGHLTLAYEGRESVLEVLALQDGRLNAVLDGAPVTARVARKGTEVSVSLGGVAHRLSLPPPPDVNAPGPGGADTSGASLTAPMPGTVVKVLVAVGDEVDEGQPLLVLEAMKMEQPFPAPRAGRVTSLPFGEGELVPGGAVLAEIEEAVKPRGRTVSTAAHRVPAETPPLTQTNSVVKLYTTGGDGKGCRVATALGRGDDRPGPLRVFERVRRLIIEGEYGPERASDRGAARRAARGEPDPGPAGPDDARGGGARRDRAQQGRDGLLVLRRGRVGHLRPARRARGPRGSAGGEPRQRGGARPAAGAGRGDGGAWRGAS